MMYEIRPETKLDVEVLKVRLLRTYCFFIPYLIDSDSEYSIKNAQKEIFEQVRLVVPLEILKTPIIKFDIFEVDKTITLVCFYFYVD